MLVDIRTCTVSHRLRSRCQLSLTIPSKLLPLRWFHRRKKTLTPISLWLNWRNRREKRNFFTGKITLHRRQQPVGWWYRAHSRRPLFQLWHWLAYHRVFLFAKNWPLSNEQLFNPAIIFSLHRTRYIITQWLKYLTICHAFLLKRRAVIQAANKTDEALKTVHVFENKKCSSLSYGWSSNTWCL